jgi:hypothetical protein
MVMVEVPTHTKVSDFFLISTVLQYQQRYVVRNSCSLDPPKALEGSPRWPQMAANFGFEHLPVTAGATTHLQ